MYASTFLMLNGFLRLSSGKKPYCFFFLVNKYRQSARAFSGLASRKSSVSLYQSNPKKWFCKVKNGSHRMAQKNTEFLYKE